MKKLPCTRCGELHTRRGMILFTNGVVYCKKCIGKGYYPPDAHIAVGDEFRRAAEAFQ